MYFIIIQLPLIRTCRYTSRYVWLLRSAVHETGFYKAEFFLLLAEKYSKKSPPTPNSVAWLMQQLCRRNYVVSSSQFDIAEVSERKQREKFHQQRNYSSGLNGTTISLH